MSSDTIAAIATALTPGAVGVVRVSGPGVQRVMSVVLSAPVPAREARLRRFRTLEGEVVDEGLALYFPGPNSFTGEDVLELQGHGGPAVLDRVLTACLSAQTPTHPIRLAAPGEFSQRAFLNDRLDLLQAEAISDLVAARSHAAAKAAMVSLQGGFSQAVASLQAELTDLRMRVEACLDFPEEDEPFLDQEGVPGRLTALQQRVAQVLATSARGAALREGLRVVLVGPPNVGKSSLMNALAERELAIVTPFAGTTRDRIDHDLMVGGIPIHVTDTAGLREADDPIEQMGVARTWLAVQEADLLLFVEDAAGVVPADAVLAQTLMSAWEAQGGQAQDVWHVHNKVDLLPQARVSPEGHHHWVSATTGAGLDGLRAQLSARAGWFSEGEAPWGARKRHVLALEAVQAALVLAAAHLRESEAELLAEQLWLAQQQLSTLTGALHPDVLLGEIFGSFCIGK